MISLLHTSSNPFGKRACSFAYSEDSFSIKRDGFSYDFVIRDKIATEHVHKILSVALAFQIQTGGDFPATAPSRDIRNYITYTATIV